MTKQPNKWMTTILHGRMKRRERRKEEREAQRTRKNTFTCEFSLLR